jgi:hypothetical protein
MHSSISTDYFKGRILRISWFSDRFFPLLQQFGASLAKVQIFVAVKIKVKKNTANKKGFNVQYSLAWQSMSFSFRGYFIVPDEVWIQEVDSFQRNSISVTCVHDLDVDRFFLVRSRASTNRSNFLPPSKVLNKKNISPFQFASLFFISSQRWLTHLICKPAPDTQAILFSASIDNFSTIPIRSIRSTTSQQFHFFSTTSQHLKFFTNFSTIPIYFNSFLSRFHNNIKRCLQLFLH